MVMTESLNCILGELSYCYSMRDRVLTCGYHSVEEPVGESEAFDGGNVAVLNDLQKSCIGKSDWARF
jgi:hypothetical protein